MPSYSDSALSDFANTSSVAHPDQSTSNSTGEPSRPDLNPPYLDTTTKDESSTKASDAIFNTPPEDYPTRSIDTLADKEFKSCLCDKKGNITQVILKRIGGTGGFGPSDIKTPKKTFEILQQLIGGPIFRSGGGSLSTTRSFTLGRLTDVNKTNDAVRVEIDPIYSIGRGRDRTRTVKLGSWYVAVPSTSEDYAELVGILTDYHSGAIDHLDPTKKKRHEAAQKAIETFESLSIADKIEIPPYKSRLEVISEQFTTHAIQINHSFSNNHFKVTAVTVSNPNGGYYQVGMKNPATDEPDTVPTCYISSSNNNPPTPNTAFNISSSFKASEITRTEIPHPPDPTIIEPDKDVLHSPLPEPRIQRSLTEIDYIGDKTNRKLWSISNERLTIEKIAFNLFGNGTNLSEDERTEILDTLNSLPHSDSIISRLKDEAKKIE